MTILTAALLVVTLARAASMPTEADDDSTETPLVMTDPLNDEIPESDMDTSMETATPNVTVADDQTASAPTDPPWPDILPSAIIDLSHWKLQLPTSRISRRARGLVDEVTPSDLASFQRREFHTVLSESHPAVALVARCSGWTTQGSEFPRTELREMVHETRRASWSTRDKKEHSLQATQAVMHVPKKRPATVIAQIVARHIDSDHDPVIQLRFTKGRRLVAVFQDHHHIIDRKVKIGQQFTWRITAGSGAVSVYYNGSTTPAYTFDVEQDSCYFKVGAYTQSNLARGERQSEYSEVWLFDLQLVQPSSSRPAIPAFHTVVVVLLLSIIV
ncbi:Alginate lyase 2 domain-containing protein [Plasmodiophora brassicae]